VRLIVRLFSDFTPTKDQMSFVGDCFDALVPDLDVDLIWNLSGDCDVALVLNYSRGLHWVRTPAGLVFKVVQEPIVLGNLARRSSHVHSKIFKSIFTHTLSGADSREIEVVPGLLPSAGIRIKEPDSEISKVKMVSVIASRLRDLPGHRLRDDLVTSVCQDPSIDIECFGRGRKNLDSKRDGLSDFRYSVAIENSASGSYITEKFLDCLFLQTVPIYFGAPNAIKHFPQEAFIPLKNLDRVSLVQALLSCSLEDYERRRASVEIARDLYVREHSLASLVLRARSISEGEGTGSMKVARVWTSDTIIRFISSVVFGAWNVASLKTKASTKRH
jgi:hypothetical protein